MGKDEAYRCIFRQAQFRHYGLEVVAARTKAMKPDDGCGRAFPGFNLNVLKILHGLPHV